MNKIRSDIFIGVLLGFAANFIGMILYVLIFIDQNFNDVIYKVNEFNLLGKIIALGAALNFLPFFILLNKNKIYMARGVLNRHDRCGTNNFNLQIRQLVRLIIYEIGDRKRR